MSYGRQEINYICRNSTVFMTLHKLKVPSSRREKEREDERECMWVGKTERDRRDRKRGQRECMGGWEKIINTCSTDNWIKR